MHKYSCHHVSSLKASCFRNYEHLSLSFEEKPIIFYGPNGAGKTNILEALSLLGTSKGFRKAQLGHFLKMEARQNSWKLKARFNSLEMEVGLDPLKNRKYYKLQDVPSTLSEYLEWIHVIGITPEIDQIFQNSPSVRRKFIDRLIESYNPFYIKQLNHYEHLLKERLLLLKTGKNQDSWLSSIENQLSTYGAAIGIERHTLIQRLVKAQHPSFPLFSSRMIGKLDEWIQEGSSSLSVEASLRRAYYDSRKEDQEQSSTHYGPHRSDWEVVYCEKNRPASLCSTGEQKILLFSVIVSFVQEILNNFDHLVILLLDDVVAHLDFYYRMVLFNVIASLQLNKTTKGSLHVFFSGTDEELFIPLKGYAQFFMVEPEIITPRY